MKRLDTRVVTRDDAPQSQARCPRCDTWADVDDDQLLGRVSLICAECGWHGFVEGTEAFGDEERP